MRVYSDFSNPENPNQMDADDSTNPVEENSEGIITDDSNNSQELSDLSEDELEYLALDKQLDDLNKALDILEQKNDSIHAQLKVLLETNRDVNKLIREANTSQEK